MDILRFEIEGCRYGLPAADVWEVVRAVAVTRLPKAPAVVEGLVNWRGTIVPVLDLRARFRHAAQASHPDHHMIVASAGERLLAFRVDRATELAAVEASAIVDAESLTRGVEYVAGVAKLADGLLLIHDLRTFLSRAEADALGQALAAASSSEGAS